MTPSSAGFVGAGFYHVLAPNAVVTAIPRIITAVDSATRAVDLLRYVVSHEERPLSVVTKHRSSVKGQVAGKGSRETSLLAQRT